MFPHDASIDSIARIAMSNHAPVTPADFDSSPQQLHDSPDGDGKKRKASEDPGPAGGQTQQRAKRNRYISIACNECKRRKIKCNVRHNPSCPTRGNCEKLIRQLHRVRIHASDAVTCTSTVSMLPTAAMASRTRTSTAKCLRRLQPSKTMSLRCITN